MCGRFTNKLTWEGIVRLYRLTVKAPPHNLPPRYNICPTDPVDVVLCAFDLLELNGRDLRRAPIEERKTALAGLLRQPIDGIAFNEHYSGDGAIIYRHACKLGCEGIVSKRLGSPYRSGRVVTWLKIKNPAAPAVTREAEEEWN